MFGGRGSAPRWPCDFSRFAGYHARMKISLSKSLIFLGKEKGKQFANKLSLSFTKQFYPEKKKHIF
jgi:hypothetical protein